MLIDFSTIHISTLLYEVRDVSALRRRRAATLCWRPTTLAPRRNGRRRPFTCLRRALGRVALTLVANLDAVVAELIPPVLADERPDYVLVIGADVLDWLIRLRAGRTVALLADLRLQLATLALQDFVLDLDDA